MLVPFRASDEPLPVSKMMVLKLCSVHIFRIVVQAKQRIDMLTSESWLCERTDLHRSNTLKQMAISESMNYSIVSPYTVMVKSGSFNIAHEINPAANFRAFSSSYQYTLLLSSSPV